MTEQLNVQQMAERLRAADNVLILCHKNPDGDTVGCGSALYYALKALDKNAAVLCSDVIPSRYAFTNPRLFKGEFEPQTVVAVDVAGIQLFGENNGVPQYTRHIDFCIDHHAGNSGYADFTLLDGQAAAAAELLYEVIMAMKVPMTAHIANCLYTGLSTDTGCFRFSSTTAKTHLVAAKLIEAGAQVEELNTLLFDTKPRARMEAERIARNHLEYHLDGRCALIYLTRDEIEQSQVDPADLEELTSLPISIEGVKVGLTSASSPAAATASASAPPRAWTPAPSPGVWAAAATPARRAVSCWATWTTPRAPFWPRWRRSWMLPRCPTDRRKPDAGNPHCG